MNWASARCRRAIGPRMKEARAGQLGGHVEIQAQRLAHGDVVARFEGQRLRIAVGAGGGRQPAAHFDVVVGRLASGALACGRLGTDMSSSFSGCRSAASSSSSCFRRTGTAWDSAMTALASSPLALSWPICLASALRRACRDSVSVWTALRRDSRSLNRSVSKDTPRVLRRSTTVCRSLRSSIGSSMVMSVRLRRASGPAAPTVSWRVPVRPARAGKPASAGF